MNYKTNFYMWGERGLVATFFADLARLMNIDTLGEFLNIVEFPKQPDIKKDDIENIDIIIEPDFGNRGFGHPDAVIAVQFKTQPRMVFILEAKRGCYQQACNKRAFRGAQGFNSCLNGQLELNYCLSIALCKFKKGDSELVDPSWVLSSDYNKERKGSLRTLKNPAVLDSVISKLYGAPSERYYHIILTSDESNPLDTACPDYLPELFKPQMTAFDMSFENAWQELRGQFGWFNYTKIESFITANETALDGGSFFLNAFEMNRNNMNSIDSVSAPFVDNSNFEPTLKIVRAPLGQTGVRMIYAPKINPKTYLHFSWRGGSCALRDYSSGSSYEDRRHSTAQVEKMIEDCIPVPNRAPVSDVNYWRERTKELNDRKGLSK
ncbi:hypothetical protein AGMMS50212_05470 [Spirochaetia bacterium]|nr:hypothetical protein AGMMS50212_05470 [Spirochaetia bacterium]